MILVNILMPMAGEGSRFKDSGYNTPKPFINVVDSTPMFKIALDSLNIDGNIILVVRSIDKSYIEKYDMYKIYFQDGKLPGAVATSMIAKEDINNEEELIIVNCDHYIEWDSKNFLTYARNYDGAVVTFKSDDAKYSYIEVDGNIVTRIVEKEVISNHATCGIYYWKHGKDFIEFSQKAMSDESKSVNNEFYISHAYEKAILENKKITFYEAHKFYDLGTPQDLHNYKML